MIKANELLRRAVVDLSSGERIGEVKEVLFDGSVARVMGLVVASGRWPRRGKDRALPFARVHAIGRDAVVLRSAEASPEELQALQPLQGGKTASGLRLVTEAGDEIGKLGSVVFDALSGRVLGYAAEKGPFEFVALQDLAFEQHAAIVPDRPEIQSWLRERYEDPAVSVSGLASAVVGRVAGADINLPDGTTIIRRGETIGATEASRAEERGRLMLLSSTLLSEKESSTDELPSEAPESPEPTEVPELAEVASPRGGVLERARRFFGRAPKPEPKAEAAPEEIDIRLGQDDGNEK